MRAIVVVGMVLATGASSAQERVITLSDLEADRPALAGDMVRVDDVIVFNFSQYRGGIVRDRSGGSAKLDDAGMTPRMIYHLERHCGGLSMTPPKPQCRGTLKFKVTLREEFRGGLTIREAEFVTDKP